MASKAKSGGIRRYQNKDGSLTAAGRERYGIVESRLDKAANKIRREQGKSVYAATGSKSDFAKYALKTGAAVAVGALATVGAYKVARGTFETGRAAGIGAKVARDAIGGFRMPGGYNVAGAVETGLGAASVALKAVGGLSLVAAGSLATGTAARTIGLATGSAARIANKRTESKYGADTAGKVRSQQREKAVNMMLESTQESRKYRRAEASNRARLVANMNRSASKRARTNFAKKIYGANEAYFRKRDENLKR